MQFEPDIEVLFEFNGARAVAAYEGYRPTHFQKQDQKLLDNK